MKMNLSTKITLGFFSTNLIYLLLLAATFILIRPAAQNSADLDQYFLPIFERAADIQFQVAEQRSTMRVYINDPNHDQNVFNQLLAHNKAASDNMTEINKILSDPGAAFLKTSAIIGVYQKMADTFKKNNDMILATPELEGRLVQSLREYSNAARDVLQALAEALQAEAEAFESEFNTDLSPAAIKRRYARQADITSLRAAIYESWVAFTRGYIWSNQELYDNSQAMVADTEKMVNSLTADTRFNNAKVREALEKSRKLLTNEYLPLLKNSLAVQKEKAEFNVRRSDLAGSTAQYAGDLVDAVSDEIEEFADKMARAMGVVNWVMKAMIIGAVVALAVSLTLALLITRSITRPINTILGHLTVSSQEVGVASSHLTGTSRALANGATENAASLEETSAALEELSSMTKRNADNASEAKILMDRAASVVGQAEGSMARVIGAMDEISRSGTEIGKIIKTIDEIAFQTNLLALNAAVEAARAGEAGSGFAVVADEVRNLAIRSADAAKNTADLIAATISNIDSGSEMVHDTSEAFKAVSVHAGKVLELVSEVAEASSEQRQGIEQITKAVIEMDKVTQANAASAEESSSAADELSIQSGSLLDVVKEINALVHGNFEQTAQAVGRRPLYKDEGASVAVRALPMGDDF